MENIAIYETPSGAARYRVRIRTKAGTSTKSFPDLDDARKWRNRQKESLAAGIEASEEQSEISELTLSAFITEVWWGSYALPSLSKKTQNNYLSHFQNWIAPSPIAGVLAREVDAEDVHDWRDWCRSKGASDDTIRSALKVISSAFTWGAKRPRRTGIKGNPVTEWPSERRSHQVVIVNQEVIERLRQAILRADRGDKTLRQRDALLLSVMAQTGMRPEEARSLKVGDVGKETIELTKTKTDRPRSVPLWRPLSEDIDAWVKATGLAKHDALVGTTDGDHLTASGWDYWRSNAWHPAREEVASLPQVKNPLLKKARAYDVCRHSYAAQQLAALTPLPNLAAILGHSVDVLSRHYAAVMPSATDPKVDPEKAVLAARAKVQAEDASA
jgi:integrase